MPSLTSHIPLSEILQIGVPTQAHLVGKASIYDKETDKSIDVSDMLPDGYQLRIVDLDESMKKLLRAHGINPDSDRTRQQFSRGIPITTRQSPAVMDVPIFRFYQDDAWKRDAFAEQIVYTAGQARAVAEGITAQIPVSQKGREYLRQTFAGKLLLLGDFPRFR